MNRKRLLWALAAALVLWAAPARADYVCSMHYQPATASSSYGDYGMFHASYYTGPDCTGTLTYSTYYCSTGATNSKCAYAGNPACPFHYLYSSAAMMQLWATHQQAQLYDQKVVPTPCTASIGLAPAFWSN